MADDYPAYHKELVNGLKDLRGGIPDTMGAFAQLAKAATETGALDPKTKELLATAIGIAVRCDGCIAFHVRAARKHGASREEILETIGMAVYMGGGPSTIYGSMALRAYDQFAEEG